MTASTIADDRFQSSAPGDAPTCPHCGSTRPGLTDDESAPERFSLRYLPGLVASRFQEALACYRYELWQAFAAMCRQTALAVFADVGEPGRLRIYDQVNEVQQLGQIEEPVFASVRRILFDTPSPRGTPEPELDPREAAVLLETMKDLLTQTYVRRARLRQALMVRQGGSVDEGARVLEQVHPRTLVAPAGIPLHRAP